MPKANITNYLLENKQSLKVDKDKEFVRWTMFGVKIVIGLSHKM